jgi:16S rRNA G966 N2-methylase RsmD
MAKVIEVCAVKDYLPIKSLKLYEDNPRQISSERLADLKKSIVEKGFYQPILVWKKDNIVLAGNHRTKAVLDLLKEGYSFEAPNGKKNVLPVVVEDIDDFTAKAILFETNTNYAEWVEDKLKSALIDAQKSGEDLKAFGFAQNELDKLLKDSIEDAERTIKSGKKEKWDESQEDEIPEVKKVSVRRGDIWRLGSHRLMCGDSTNAKDMKKLTRVDGFVKSSPVLVLTDPPYELKSSDIMESLKNSRCDDWMVICTMRQAVEIIPQTHFHFDLVLHCRSPKGSFGNTKQPWYLHQNVIYIGRKKESIFDRVHAKGSFNDGLYYPTIIDSPRDFQNGFHAKSVDAMVKLMAGFPQGLVLDCFAGAGATLLACSKVGRKCLAMELEAERCQVIIDRWERITGKKAEKET